jgi:hypothetical protein
MAELQTEFAAYLVALRTASPGKDLTTLVVKNLATVRAGVAASAQLDDANTMYKVYLTVDT